MQRKGDKCTYRRAGGQRRPSKVILELKSYKSLGKNIPGRESHKHSDPEMERKLATTTEHNKLGGQVVMEGVPHAALAGHH